MGSWLHRAEYSPAKSQETTQTVRGSGVGVFWGGCSQADLTEQGWHPDKPGMAFRKLGDEGVICGENAG